MDARTGEIHQIDEKMFKQLEQSGDLRHMIPLTERQVEEMLPMNANRRKNNMRNLSCICGSGVKFKRCCWSKYE